MSNAIKFKDPEDEKKLAKEWFERLRDQFCKKFEEIDGGSFKTILFNESARTISRQVEGIFFHVPYKNGIALKRPHSAVRKGDYKLIKFQDDKSILLFGTNLETLK